MAGRAARPVGSELEAEEAALADALENDRAGPVSEQHGRPPVAPVQDLREHVPADDQRPLREAPGEHPVGLGDGVHEARAASGEIVGACVMRAQLVREDRRGRRKRHIGGDGGDDDQIEVGA